MQELIELRTFIENKQKQAQERHIHYVNKKNKQGYHATVGYDSACLDIIEQLDLILNNSVVKPSERRSPTDETFSGCKPPDERQNPQEYKILECGCSIKLIDNGVSAFVNKNCEPHMEFLKSVKDKEDK